MRQVLFLPNSLVPRIENARWVGKPRAHWLIETYADAYRESGHVDQFDINNILQKKIVNELAQQRLNMFSWHSTAHLFTESFITESFVIKSGHMPGPASEIIDVYTPFAPFCFSSSEHARLKVQNLNRWESRGKKKSRKAEKSKRWEGRRKVEKSKSRKSKSILFDTSLFDFLNFCWMPFQPNMRSSFFQLRGILPPCLIICFFPSYSVIQTKIMLLQGSQVQFHSAKQIAKNWSLQSAAAAACAMQFSKLLPFTFSFGLSKLLLTGA